MATKKKKRFSVRQGVRPEPSPGLEEAPEALRYFLLEYLQDSNGGYAWLAAEVLEHFLRRPGLKTNFSNIHDPTAWPRLYDLIQQFEWWKVYDLIEEIHSKLPDHRHQEFVRQVNEVLTLENTLWKMNYDGEIVYKGSEPFEYVVYDATSTLHKARRKTAKDEMHKAIDDLSKRPRPDLTGAVHHAMAALECVAADVCGEKGGTLGQIVKRHPDKFPPPVGEAVSKLYGFASDKGRHITEGGEPDLKEVELIVGIAATVASYLSRAGGHHS